MEPERLAAALAGRYRLERELGRGGMATVYLAEDLKHHRQVAIKVLKPELAAALGPDRFLREIETSARLHHPHVLPLYDSGEADGFLYYVMPLVEGESLRDRLEREKQLPIEEALRIAREAADALSYAHSHGIVHRDVKPENILLEASHAVVADFGIARAITAAGGAQLTGTGVSVGTPAYMSPEQAAGSRDLDGRSDLYSLACVLYEMLAGTPPFGAPTAEGLIHQHLTAEPRPVTQIRSAVPAAVDGALRKALSKTPADRFPTAAQFAEALSGAAGVVATPSAPVYRRRAVGLAALAGAVLLLAVGGYVALRGRDSAGAGSAVPRLVVLPFENLGTSEDEYFADGITDEVTARLTSLSGLAVIARQSAVLYKKSGKTPQQVGEELDADYLLEATISWQRAPTGGSRVRLRPQLIRAADATHVWADVYDEDMTELFAVQSRIANKVVEALGVALVEPERRSLAAAPTRNPEAHDYYLRGLDYSARTVRVFTERDVRIAIEMFQRAVDLDPRFAAAYAGLGEAHRDLYWYAVDRSDERLRTARSAIDRALELDPELPEARLALANYYYALFDYNRALAELDVLRQRQPHNAEVVFTIAAVRRRQGRFQDAVRDFEEAERLDPRSATAAYNLGLTYWLLRNYAPAERELERAVSLSPESPLNYMSKVRLHLAWTGSIARARAALAGAERIGLAAEPLIVHHAVMLDVLDGRYDSALRRLRDASAIDAFDWQFWFVPRAQWLAEVFRLLNQPDSAREYYDAARRVLEAKVRESPDDPRYHSSLAIVYAGLGREADAVRAARQGVDVLPVSKEAYRGLFAVEARAQVYTMVGDYDAAITELERLLSIPSHLSAALLRLDPRWDPLRAQPRFRALVEAR